MHRQAHYRHRCCVMRERRRSCRERPPRHATRPTCPGALSPPTPRHPYRHGRELTCTAPHSQNQCPRETCQYWVSLGHTRPPARPRRPAGRRPCAPTTPPRGPPHHQPHPPQSPRGATTTRQTRTPPQPTQTRTTQQREPRYAARTSHAHAREQTQRAPDH